MTTARAVGPVVRAFGPLVRGLRWTPIAGAAGIGVVLVVLAVRTGDPGPGIGALRATAALLAGAAGAALDDPAAPTVSATPLGAVVRRVLQLVVLVVTVSAAWLLLLAAVLVGIEPGLPAGVAARLGLEAAALLAAGLGVAGIAITVERRGVGGSIAAPVLVAGVLAALVVQATWPAWTLLPLGAGDPRC